VSLSKSNSSGNNPDATDIQEGDVIGGSYQVIGLIGVGGMGAVWKVHHTFLNKQFALKTIPREELTQATWERFKLEAKTLARLDHVNLVKIYDLGMAKGNLPFYVMELLDGESLADKLKRKGALGMEETVAIFAQVATGLAYAHEKGLVHRDIKPGNIMLTDFTQEGRSPVLQVKLLDFGIAKLVKPDASSEESGLTGTFDILGSPFYMSPEQSQGAAVDYRADIYSLGCTLFEALTGTPPFMGESPLITMMKHQKETPPTLKEATLGREFPPLLEAIVARLLAKPRDARYQRLDELVKDLSMVLVQRQETSRKSTRKSVLEEELGVSLEEKAQFTVNSVARGTTVKRPVRTLRQADFALEEEPLPRNGKIKLWLILGVGAVFLLALALIVFFLFSGRS
jgi:serine/threonine-protein kinase